LKQPGLELHCVRYEDVAQDPERELRKVVRFLGLPYEAHMAEGEGNREGVPVHELGWKAIALQRITSARIGQWREELTPTQVRNMERWGRLALQTLGYELTMGEDRGFPVGAYLQARWSQFAWNVRQTWRLATGASLDVPKPKRSPTIRDGMCPSPKS
jgi:hypothetical protein